MGSASPIQPLHPVQATRFIMRKLLLLLLCLLAYLGPAHGAVSCEDSGLQSPIGACLKSASDEAEVELNAAYRGLLSRLSSTTGQPGARAAMRESLRLAQRSWVAYREADCRALYMIHEGESVQEMNYIQCMTARAKTRIEELGAFPVKD